MGWARCWNNFSLLSFEDSVLRQDFEKINFTGVGNIFSLFKIPHMKILLFFILSILFFADQSFDFTAFFPVYLILRADIYLAFC